MPRRTRTVSGSVVVTADALELYRAVADPSQMPRWSPENTGATVPHPGEPLPEGATFLGTNRRGRARWTTRCMVVAADPGRRFAFDVGEIGLRRPVLHGPIARWDWEFEPVAGGTRVTETWTDQRVGVADRVATGLDRVLTGGRSFADFQRRNIARTLARLKAEFEAAAEGQERPDATG